MEPTGEDATSELLESLRKLSDSEILWARLVGKFLGRQPIPILKDGSDEIPLAEGDVFAKPAGSRSRPA
jgi:hypothetical protein